MQKPEVGGGGCPEPKMRDRAGKGEVNGKGWVSVSPPPPPLLVASQSLHLQQSGLVTHMCAQAHTLRQEACYTQGYLHTSALCSLAQLSLPSTSLSLSNTHRQSHPHQTPCRHNHTPQHTDPCHSLVTGPAPADPQPSCIHPDTPCE